jgi:hypothetical protein
MRHAMCSWRISQLALASLTSTRGKQHLPCLSTIIVCRSGATRSELLIFRSECCASLTPTQLHWAHAFIATTSSCSSNSSAMSTKSLKRLSVRAKRSISGLHAFCDVFDSACASPSTIIITMLTIRKVTKRTRPLISGSLVYRRTTKRPYHRMFLQTRKALLGARN